MNYDRRKKVSSFLRDIPYNYPVGNWRYQGIYLWPVIKNMLFFQSLDDKSSSDRAPFSIRRFRLRSFFRFVYFLTLDRRPMPRVFGTHAHFRYKLEGTLINKYYAQLTNENDFFVLDHYNADAGYRGQVDHRARTFFTFEIRFIVLFWRNIFYRSRVIGAINTPEMKEMLSRFNSEFGTRITIQSISRQVYYIYLLSRVFKRLMKRHAVREVYVLCYYLSEMRAMIIAGNELGADTYDMQHGSQGSMHEAYNDFGAIPKEGYSTLPRFFWCWNGDSAAMINGWAQRSDRHKALNKGNTWHAYLKFWRDFNWKPEQNLYLITLQPLDESLVDYYMLEVIRSSPDWITWYIRLHPRQSLLLDELNALIGREGLTKRVNTRDANQLPLPVLLAHSTLHFSKFSGSIEEAAEYGVFSVILHAIGVETYGGLIDQRKAVALTNGNAEEILGFLKKNLEKA